MIPFVPIFIQLPASLTTAFFGDELYRIEIWKSVTYMLFENVLPEQAGLSNEFLTSFGFTGIGLGDGAFNDIYSMFYPAASEQITHSHSLFLQIFINIGLPGIITFTAILFFILQLAY